MARWIGIDFGIVRTGIAFTDDTERLAFPFATVPTAELMIALERLDQRITVPWIGLGHSQCLGPLHWVKHVPHSTEPILAFQAKLKQRWPALPIELMDETNTSEEALQASIAGGMKKVKAFEKRCPSTTWLLRLFYSVFWDKRNAL